MCLCVSCLIAVNWKIDKSAMHCYQHVSYVWPKTTRLVCRAPQHALGSEQINLHGRNTEALLEPKLSFSYQWWGQGKGWSWEDKGKLRNCSTSQPVNYCSFPACMKGETRITAIEIIFLHCCIHLLFTVNIPGRRAAKQRLALKTQSLKHAMPAFLVLRDEGGAGLSPNF